MTVDLSALHPRHRRRARRAIEEVEKLRRWAAFRAAYAAACETTPHGDRTALRLDLGAEMGMDDRETEQALYGR